MTLNANAHGDLHVVLGAGPAGTAIVRELLGRGRRVRHVNRSPIADAHEAVETAVADVSSADQACVATAGATTIYHAVNVPYHLQVAQMPRIADAVIAAGARNDARVVVLDTLYPYGEADGEAITEETPWSAISSKGRMRAELDRRYLDAHAAGHVRVALGRSADFYGPGVMNSTLGGAFFPAALSGGHAVVFGDIDLPHSYSYIRDVAAGLVDLGTADDTACGRIWHLPTVPAESTRNVIACVGRILGREVPTRIVAEPGAVGPFDEQFMREYAEMFYQHRVPQNMVSATFERAFHRSPTPLSEGLTATIDWYRTIVPS
ncbi:NAD-dependent epimerase/dehydratase family protein [Tsukamurella sp. 8F]|uniref:NAD-dependent epimerase/dehydratase family protein n=1 Tax=unclassified Tsukamurella TaxID=2633480 RepID=UPI0023B96B67|nr:MULTISPECIES: NAD-dependent epimerase/dehydratase family protein [unclassified Tsukamurella]MDF0530988.1 NAD-dependent epimerase/dehydratase family protein [Tsukamurella sp. 8J]MDF0588689.1 NAD-dependent epimerase/dehydratase family protein [Tsukamurella sp. 8F]